ncbi:MAG: hypothetical protein IT292_07985 [Deltaproteobacteria bacterium]|nr:hypothetical protein [Deltaproteobacteria bacterium]
MGRLNSHYPKTKNNVIYDGAVGAFATGTQLIGYANKRLMVWNDYLNKGLGNPADIIVGLNNEYSANKKLVIIS